MLSLPKASPQTRWIDSHNTVCRQIIGAVLNCLLSAGPHLLPLSPFQKAGNCAAQYSLPPGVPHWENWWEAVSPPGCEWRGRYSPRANVQGGWPLSTLPATCLAGVARGKLCGICIVGVPQVPSELLRTTTFSDDVSDLPSSSPLVLLEPLPLFQVNTGDAFLFVDNLLFKEIINLIKWLIVLGRVRVGITEVAFDPDFKEGL